MSIIVYRKKNWKVSCTGGFPSDQRNNTYQASSYHIKYLEYRWHLQKIGPLSVFFLSFTPMIYYQEFVNCSLGIVC